MRIIGYGAMVLAFVLLGAVISPAAEVKLPADTQSHLLFYAPFEKSASAQFAKGQKEPLVVEKVEFPAGKKGSGILIEEMMVCKYSRTGNFNPAQGTLMMWVKRGEGSDTFFTVGKEWYGKDFFTFRLVEFQSNTHSAIKSKGELLGSTDLHMVLPKGEWHHYALTWGNGKLAFYVDGQLKESKNLTGTLEEGNLPDEMWLGSGPNGLYPANSVIDELYIFDAPLTPEQINIVMQN